MANQTFELVSPFLSIYAPSRTFNGGSDLLKGQTNNALVPGELLSFDTTNTNYGVTREIPANLASSAVGDVATQPGFVFFSETGRGDLITGGKVPVLQFGPYEADTQVFARSAAGILQNEAANGNGGAGADLTAANGVGKPVGIAAVRHPTKYASAAPNTADGAAYGNDSGADLIIPGLTVLTPAQIAAGAFVAGHISRITGSGANMKVRVLFGL